MYYITAKIDTKVSDLLVLNLPDKFKDRFAIILKSGGVWYQRKRHLNDTIIPAKETIKVYVTATQGHQFILTKDMIFAEENDFLVVKKPPGINTVSDRSDLYWNLTSGIKQYFMDQGNLYDPQPMTRLDLMVTGLVLYPKNKEAEKSLFKMTQQRKIKKLYHATLSVKPDLPDCLRVKDKLSFLKKAKVSHDGKPSHTLFLKHNHDGCVNNVTYSAIIFTGRRHQIRAHAAYYLSPIRGDSFYGSKEPLPDAALELKAVGLNFSYKNKRYRFRLKK